MTENEIKEYIADLRNKADVLRKSGFATNGVSNHFDKSADVIEELLSYRAIGTIEEIKALKEKSVAKKVNIEQWIDTKCSCGYVFSKHHGDGYHSIPYENKTEYCPRCGQKLDWE